jgi:Tfp pilus assembly protein FimT
MNFENKSMRKLSASSGFTLIELLVVFAFIAILTSLGIAAYASYNSGQEVESSAANVESLLNTAKSRSLTQVIPTTCGANPLTGYQIDVTVGGQQYTLSAICGTKQVVTTNNLPPNVVFGNGSTSSTFFAVSSGTLTAQATILITGYGQTRTVTINTLGSISIN